MKRFVCLVLWCGLLSCFSGCDGGEKFPADFPRVYPLTVTVKDGTTPLSDVRIMFYPASKGAGAAYASSGSTNANGVAKIITAQGGFSKAGIPAGEYVVTVEDIIKVTSDIPPEEKVKMSMTELNTLAAEQKKKMATYERKIPDVLCKARAASVETRSPIRFTATEKNNVLTIDVAGYK